MSFYFFFFIFFYPVDQILLIWCQKGKRYIKKEGGGEVQHLEKRKKKGVCWFLLKMGKTIRERNNHQSLRKLEEEEEEIFENWRWACAQGEQPHSMNERRRKKKKKNEGDLRSLNCTEIGKCVCVCRRRFDILYCVKCECLFLSTHKKRMSPYLFPPPHRGLLEGRKNSRNMVKTGGGCSWKIYGQNEKRRRKQKDDGNI